MNRCVALAYIMSRVEPIREHSTPLQIVHQPFPASLSPSARLATTSGQEAFSLPGICTSQYLEQDQDDSLTKA